MKLKIKPENVHYCDYSHFVNGPTKAEWIMKVDEINTMYVCETHLLLQVIHTLKLNEIDEKV